MANSYSVIDYITKEALRIAHEKSTFLGTIDRQYDEEFGKKGMKVGSAIRIRQPEKGTIRTGRVANVQDMEEPYTTLTVSTQKGFDLAWNSAEAALSLDDYIKRKVEPRMASLISNIESEVLQGATKLVYNLAGTAGTVVGASSDISALGAARAKLNQQLAPKDNQRYVQMDSVTMASVSNAIKSLFHEGNQVEEAFREGFITRNAMATFYENERTYTHLNDQDDVAGAVDDAAALAAYTDADGVATLNVDALGTTNVSVGSVFTIADLYDCHPETKASYSHLKQFTVTAVGTFASNQVEITFSPTIHIAGAKQNCYLASGAIADLEDNVVTFVGSADTSYRHNLMYHKEFMTFATADLPLMAGADRCVRRNYDGLSLRVWEDSDIKNDEHILRVDILYGWQVLRPEWACRITN